MMMTDKLSHIDETGRARMVDVSSKDDTERVAIAKGEVVMQAKTLELIRDGMIKKGDVLAVAQIAGIMAAKRTSELIPMCHPLPLLEIKVDLVLDDRSARCANHFASKDNRQNGCRNGSPYRGFSGRLDCL